MDINFCLKTSAIWQFVGYVIFVIKIIVPLVIIVLGVINLSKCVVSGKDDEIKSTLQSLFKKIVIGIIIFFIPTITKLVFSLVKEASESMQYAEGCISCMLTPFSDVCKKAVETAADVRKNKNEELYNKFYEFANSDKKQDVNYLNEKAGGNPSSDNKGAVANNCKGNYKNELQNTEPNPSNVIACWPELLNSSDFIYSQNSTKMYGAWPKNYDYIPKHLTISNYYGPNNAFILPTTASDSTYKRVYRHNGIDIMTVFGTAVYSPVSGTLKYSEWGHTTKNRHGGESAYSVEIYLDEPVVVTGHNEDGVEDNYKITIVYLTHMSGITNRCAEGECNIHINQGDLIGFTGNAQWDETQTNWTPHLHMSFYGNTTTENNVALFTEDYEAIYGLSEGSTLVSGR